MAATIEVSGLAGAAAIERAFAILTQLGAVELELKDARAPISVLALFSEEDGERLRSRVAGALEAAHVSVSAVLARPAQLVDWDSRWSESLRPLRVGPLWIVPHGASPPITGRSLELDTGGAFGSGAHATTMLCLEKIVELSPIATLLDVGTGTGILALAALALGAERAVAIDDDPLALEIAARNAAHNALRLELSSAAPIALHEQFEVVVANILPSSLIALAPQVIRCVGHRGLLVLSGLRVGDRDDVLRAYEHYGLHALQEVDRSGWLRVDLVASW